MARWKIRCIKALLLLIILTGLAMACYPLLAEQQQKKKVSYLTAGLNESFEELTEAEQANVKKEAEDFNKKLLDEPNRWEMSEDLKDLYYETLDVSGTGMMGLVSIPKLSAEVPIYHGDKTTTLQAGAGHMEGSSLPIGGKSTHAVIAAHTGMASAELFTRLDEMEAGDSFYVEILSEKLEYKVTEIRTVLPTDTKYLGIQDGKDLVTLITCTPPGINSHRLLVTGERVIKIGKEKELGQVYMLKIPNISQGLTALGILAVLLVIFKVLRKALRKIK